MLSSSGAEALCCCSLPRNHWQGQLFPPSLPLSPESLLCTCTVYKLSLSLAHFMDCLSIFISSHLHAQLFPLTMELLQLLLQQSRVTGRNILGQVRLHGVQFPQSTVQMLEGKLSLLHNTHINAHLKHAVRQPCTSCAHTVLNRALVCSVRSD